MSKLPVKIPNKLGAIVVLTLMTAGALVLAVQARKQGSIPSHASSSTYFVDNSLTANCLNNTYSIAARNCNGSDGNAYVKINDAIHDRAVSPGSLISVRQGTYQEVYQYDSAPRRNKEAAFYINKAVTLKNYNGEQAILTYIPSRPPLNNNNEYNYLIDIVTSNVTLDGFTIVGTRSLGDNPTAGTDVNISIDGSFADITIQNNIITQAGHAGIKYPSPTGTTLIQNNQFYDIGFTARDHGIYAYSSNTNTASKIIRYNIFHDITGYGIHVYSEGSNHDIYGNIVYNNGNGGILITGDHNKIFNNVIYGNKGYGGLVLYKYYIHDERIENNIIWNNSNDIVCDEGTATGNVLEHNDVKTLWGTGGVCSILTSATDVSLDPQFVSAAPASWQDFRLDAASPLIDYGSNLGTPYNLGLNPISTAWPLSLTDQNRYGSNWEIGAFVAGSPSGSEDTTPPSAQISSPADGGTVPKNSTVTITATASDNIEVAKVEFLVNNTRICTDTTSVYECAWKIPTGKSTIYSLQVKAYDSAGNFGASAIVKVTAK